MLAGGRGVEGYGVRFTDVPDAADTPPGGPPYWLVRVSGLYLGPNGGLVGAPKAARVWTNKVEAVAKAREVRERKLWLGRVVVVRRKNLRARMW